MCLCFDFRLVFCMGGQYLMCLSLCLRAFHHPEQSSVVTVLALCMCMCLCVWCVVSCSAKMFDC